MTTTLDLLKEAAAAHGIADMNFSEPEHRMLIANDLRFHYVDWGGDGCPVLFLHGGGQTCRTWDMVCLQLRDSYRCIALDQRNHGDSEKSTWGDTSYRTQCEDVRGVVARVGLERFALVGMSMGGLNTLAYASTRPPELQAAVVVDITPTAHSEGTKPIGNFSRPRAFDSIEAALEEAVAFNPRRARVHLHYSLLHALRQRADGKWVWKHERIAPPVPESNPDAREGLLPHFEALWDEVGQIACPTLVVHGGESKVIRREDAERLARAIPAAEAVTVPGAGHTVQGDEPVALATELERFLKRVL